MRAERFDAVLLDLGLADGDGGDLLRRLRLSPAPGAASAQVLPDPSTPVLIVTARDQVHQRIAGLDQGADDYLAKPFDMDELDARLRALLRRAAGRASPTIRYGDIEMDPAARTVHQGGKLVEMSPREFSVLLVLLEARGRVLAPADRRAPVQLGCCHREQCGGGPHSPPAAQAGQRMYPDHARCGLLHAPGGGRMSAAAATPGGSARRPSLTRQLLLWSLGALVLVWGSFVFMGYQTGCTRRMN